MVDGYAQLDLEVLKGKGQTVNTALYIAPGVNRAAGCLQSQQPPHRTNFCTLLQPCPQQHPASLSLTEFTVAQEVGCTSCWDGAGQAPSKLTRTRHELAKPLAGFGEEGIWLHATQYSSAWLQGYGATDGRWPPGMLSVYYT